MLYAGYHSDLRRSLVDIIQSSNTNSLHGIRVIICIMRRSDEGQECCMTQILTTHKEVRLNCWPGTGDTDLADLPFDQRKIF